MPSRSIILVFALLVSAFPAFARDFFLDVEGGGAFSGYNDVRIPPDGGSEFSLSEELSADAAVFGRLRAGFRFGGKHRIFALAAPLRLSSSGRSSREIVFHGASFPAGTDLNGTFRFDSYRLGYRYDFEVSRAWRLGLGVTAKIRDAEIRLEGGGRESAKVNTGFVPLLGFYASWQATETLGVIMEGDGLASPGGEGRAEDVFIGLTYRMSPRVDWRAGYRLLEGGADVESVYNFALIHFAALGVTVRW